MIINRVWAMPNKWTFQIPPIRDFVLRYIKNGDGWIDAFSGYEVMVEFTNDLNPDTPAASHLDARAYLKSFNKKCVIGIIIDPPYSQVQVARAYKSVGREYKPFGDDNNAVLYRQIRDEANRILLLGGIVLSFGWNSAGMGKKRGYEILEVLLVCHGASHNDTICMAERKIIGKQS